MRIIAVAAFAVSAVLWAGAAFAEMPALYSRTVSYKITAPCNVLVAEGEVVLGWDDCRGDYELVTVDYAGFDHPLALLFWTGTPDFAGLDEHAYWSFFCGKCYKWQPDNYCMLCNDCEWYCYKTSAERFCDTIYARSYLPSCLKFEITHIY